MTGDSLFTHQLPRAAEQSKPYLLEQHPQLQISLFWPDKLDHILLPLSKVRLPLEFPGQPLRMFFLGYNNLELLEHRLRAGTRPIVDHNQWF